MLWRGERATYVRPGHEITVKDGKSHVAPMHWIRLADGSLTAVFPSELALVGEKP